MNEKIKNNARYLARKNIVIRQDQLCERCKKKKATIRHHPDYDKPIDVELLCNECHGIRHRIYKSARQTTILLNDEVANCLVKQSEKQERSLNYLINMILKKYFNIKNEK